MKRKKKPRTVIIPRLSRRALRSHILLVAIPSGENPFGRFLPKFRTLLILLSALFCWWLVPPGAFARPPEHKEKPYALIFGTVWGPDNRGVAGVQVKIALAGKKRAKWEAISNRIGEFEQRVPAGKAEYLLWCEFKPPKDSKYHNYKRLRAETTIQVQNEERVDTGLHLK